MKENKIICGAMPGAAKVIPDGSVNCCISSPPYWALRDYGTATWEGGKPDCDHQTPRSRGDDFGNSKQGTNKGSRPNLQDICGKCGAKRIDKQLGLEPTFEEYIDKLCTIYDEVKRVLRDDGTCWVNLGDTYATQSPVRKRNAVGYGSRPKDHPLSPKVKNVREKSLCLIPQRFAIEMVNRGWILRNVIIWHKPNPMPSSAKDRFTVDFEYVYFFVKSKKYWFEPQYEPYNYDGRKQTEMRAGEDNKWQGIRQQGQTPQSFHRGAVERWPCPLGRNKRTVWTIPTQPFPEAHFATFPEKLVEPMILAGCPEFVCTKCGKGREKIYDTEYVIPETRPSSPEIDRARYEDKSTGVGYRPDKVFSKKNYFKGYTDCGCNAEYRPGIVMDIFAGSGTTLQVAARLRRDWIGIELKGEYIEMAEKRAQQGETGIKVKEQKAGQLALFKE